MDLFNMSLISCMYDCGLVSELGPPPDLILNLPPPPVPAFLQNSAELLVATNGSCNFCNWARGIDIPYLEVSRKRQSNDATYFIAISASIGFIIIAILVIIAVLRYKVAKLKSVPDVYVKREHTSSRVSSSTDTTLNSSRTPEVYNPCPQPKALWSGLGSCSENSPYILQHQPVSREDPERLAHYDYIDYGSNGHTYAYPAEVVHIINDGENHYHYPDSLDVSFENTGYVDSESHATSL